MAMPGRGPDTPPPSATNELIERCRRGDRAALDEVFRAHAPALERLLARLAGPRADVEDLLQDTFAAAITAFPRFRGEASVKTWLHRIAVNVTHSQLRSPRHRAVPLDDDAEDTRATGESPEDQVASSELAACLYAHLDKLDARKRIALILHVIDDRPIAEVAALMGASHAATKSRIFFARRALLRRLRRDPALAAHGVDP